MPVGLWTVDLLRTQFRPVGLAGETSDLEPPNLEGGPTDQLHPRVIAFLVVRSQVEYSASPVLAFEGAWRPLLGSSGFRGVLYSPPLLASLPPVTWDPAKSPRSSLLAVRSSHREALGFATDEDGEGRHATGQAGG